MHITSTWLLLPCGPMWAGPIAAIHDTILTCAGDTPPDAPENSVRDGQSNVCAFSHTFFRQQLCPAPNNPRRDGPGLGPTHRSGRRLRHPGPAHRDVPVPAWPGQALYLALCDQPLVGHGTHAPQAAGPLFFAGARAAGGALCAGRASKRLTSCTASAFHRPPTFRNRAITGFARRLQRARGRWRACLEKRRAELFHLVRPRRGGARQRASQHSAPPRVRGRR